MEVYVITVLEEWLDGNSAYTCDKCSRTLAGAKKLLSKYAHDIAKEYETEMGADCEITKEGTMLTTISVNDDYGVTTLEIQKITLAD